MEAIYAYYALHKLHIMPSYFCAMPKREQLFVIACIDKKIEDDDKKQKELKRKQKKRR